MLQPTYEFVVTILAYLQGEGLLLGRRKAKISNHQANFIRSLAEALKLIKPDHLESSPLDTIRSILKRGQR